MDYMPSATSYTFHIVKFDPLVLVETQVQILFEHSRPCRKSTLCWLDNDPQSKWIARFGDRPAFHGKSTFVDIWGNFKFSLKRRVDTSPQILLEICVTTLLENIHQKHNDVFLRCVCNFFVEISKELWAYRRSYIYLNWKRIFFVIYSKTLFTFKLNYRPDE